MRDAPKRDNTFKVSSALSSVFRRYRIFSLILIVVVLGLTFALISPIFLKPANFNVIMLFASVLGIMAIGMGLLLCIGQFDLSIGSIFVLTAVVMAKLSSEWGMSPVVCILVALSLGTALGSLNGIIITKTGTSSIIVTLGTMWSFRGIALILSGGYTTPYIASGLVSEIFTGKIGFVPVQILWMVAIGIIAWILLNRTGFGNRLMAIGSNSESARMMGVNPVTTTIIVFGIMGLLAAFAGVVETTRYTMSIPYSGQMYNLQAIAAAVIGGTAITGGVGSIMGCVTGALLIQMLSVGLVIIGFSSFLFTVALGIVLIGAMIANEILRKKR